MADDAMDTTHSRVFHVLEVCKVMGAHKQVLANQACVRSSLKAMAASVHEAEVRLNAAPVAPDQDDSYFGLRSCIPDDDPRVEAIVSTMEQEGNGRALAALKNLTAERYWEARWKREWQTKYHDPLAGIKRQEQEYIALGALDIGIQGCKRSMKATLHVSTHTNAHTPREPKRPTQRLVLGGQRRRAQRVRAALKDRHSKPEFDPVKRARKKAEDFVLRRRRGPIGEGGSDGRPRTAFGKTNKPTAAVAKHNNVYKPRAARGPATPATAPAAMAAATAVAEPRRQKEGEAQGGWDIRRYQGTIDDLDGDGREIHGEITAATPERQRPLFDDDVGGMGASAYRSRTTRCRTADPGGSAAAATRRGRLPKSTFARCPRFADGPGWDKSFTDRVLLRLAKRDPPVFDYTEGALDLIARNGTAMAI